MMQPPAGLLDSSCCWIVPVPSGADDQAMHDALIRHPTLQDEKISWLQRHDKECGGLYGLLPLVRGMRVACTTHLDRSEKALLRGRSGTLVGWKLDPRDDRPAAACKGDYQLQFPPIAVFVQFYEKKLKKKKRVPAKWTLDGLPQVSHHYPGSLSLTIQYTRAL